MRNVPRRESRELLGNGEEDFAQGVVVNLMVDARPLRVGHRFRSLLRVGHAAAIRVAGRASSNIGPGNDFRAQSRAGPDALAERQDKIDVPAHIASSNDSFCDE